MKKWLISLGALGATVVPVSAVISCGGSSSSEDTSQRTTPTGTSSQVIAPINTSKAVTIKSGSAQVTENGNEKTTSISLPVATETVKSFESTIELSSDLSNAFANRPAGTIKIGASTVQHVPGQPDKVS